jgi:formate hydrogenlyase subunit 6/NADH:ubiquinone oxidoreductase subunit I
MTHEQKTYWSEIGSTVKSLSQGLKITFKHILSSRKTNKTLFIADKNYFNNTEGISTIQYPHEIIPVPDNGRYRLHNEIDDCIVCDKCAKVCPVNCITIEPIKAVEEIGKTSDGTSKRIYAAKFDIDMGQCCFCGLCTTVCPTECLTMTKVFDFSVTDIREHNFAFAEMAESEIVLKKKELEDFQKSKATAAAAVSIPEEKKENTVEPIIPAVVKPAGAKPVFKPKIKPAGPPPSA